MAGLAAEVAVRIGPAGAAGPVPTAPAAAEDHALRRGVAADAAAARAAGGHGEPGRKRGPAGAAGGRRCDRAGSYVGSATATATAGCACEEEHRLAAVAPAAASADP